MDRSVLARKPMTELKDIASHLDMRGYQKLRKAELIDAIVASATGEAPSAAEGDGGSSARKVLPPGARNGELAEDAQAGDDVASADAVGAADAAAVDADQAAETERQDSDAGSADDADDADEADDAEGEDESGGSRDQGDGEAASLKDEASSQGRRRGNGSKGESSSSGGGRRDGGDADDDGGRKRSRRKRNRGDDSGSGRSDQQGSRGQRSGGDDGDDGDGSRSDSGRGDSGRKDSGRGSSGRNGGSGADDDSRDSGKKDADKGGKKDSELGEVRAGVLDILPEGYGFLRTTGYLPGNRDVYVSQGQIRKHSLRRGDVVQGPIRQQRSNEKVPALHHVQRVNGAELVSGRVADRSDFRQLTAIHADEQLVLSGPDSAPVLRAIDLLAPIGRGHRGLILAPYAGGRTELIKAMANGMAEHSSDVHLMVVLVDERPEDVTDVERSVPGEVISSTFDHPVDEHAQVAELALERARRLVELGHDVVILLDSLTRLSRAHGAGQETPAIHAAKRFFGAARNVEEGGSLTILATLQVDTGSEVDAAVTRELQTTANVLITLDGEIDRSERPAVRPDATQTLREERLLDDEALRAVRARRDDAVGGATGAQATAALIRTLS